MDDRDLRLDRIRARTAQLGRLDAHRQVFGAATHDYRFEQPLGGDELGALERDLGVALPDAYRQFVVRVGRAGAGPYYGLVPAAPLEARLTRAGEPPPRLAAPFPFDGEVGFDVPAPAGRCRYDGVMLLAEQGCGYQSMLIVSGPRAGEVWCDFSEAHEPFAPEAPGLVEWYEAWLDGALVEWLRHAAPGLLEPRDGDDEARRVAIEAVPLLEVHATAPPPTPYPADRDETLRTLGYARLLAGDDDAALAAFSQARDAGDAEPAARLWLDRARMCRRRGDREGALAAARAGLAEPDLWASTRDELARLAERDADHPAPVPGGDPDA